ncbi:lymphocyte antigen 6D-like [Sparus aurata]|uniref:lymphocyte antigen 6D-like n=1 Tax=Sparus aurata TaxID=8175 RepID=UPI0011C0DCFA|nr:lymphocyte antigen 6D-like [Sparus aurata]
MKLIFSLSLIWALSSTAGALVCQSCNDDQCSNPQNVTCSNSETMCVTATALETRGRAITTQIFKSCASSSLCPATGPRSFSVSFGTSSSVTSAECCNTDNCNTKTLNTPGTPKANSLQCFSCNTVCVNSLQCRGDEDRCFQSTGESL